MTERMFLKPVADHAGPGRHFAGSVEIAPHGIGAGHWAGQLLVHSVHADTATIRTLRLAHPSGTIPFSFRPGQYIDVGLEVDGQTLHRSYSISSSARERRWIDITVKREAGGLVSPVLCEQTLPGDRLDIRGPFGQFIFDGREAPSVALIGAGVGVTPLVSMIRTLRDDGWPGGIHAVFGFRSEDDMLFHEELSAFADEDNGFTLTVTLSKPADPKSRPKGRVSPRLVRKSIPGWRRQLYFLCGPLEMMDTLTDSLIEHGVAPDLVRSEAFAPLPRDGDLGGIFELTFERSGTSVHSAQGESILETAARAGIGLDYSCMNGSCGLCVARLLEGDVDMLADDALSRAEQEDGDILTCQSFPCSPCRIDI